MADSTKLTFDDWSSHETWVMNLWLNNDEVAYKAMKHIKEQYDDVDDQAAMLEEWVSNVCIDDNANPLVINDMLVCAFESVDWIQIIECNK